MVAAIGQVNSAADVRFGLLLSHSLPHLFCDTTLMESRELVFDRDIRQPSYAIYWLHTHSCPGRLRQCLQGSASGILIFIHLPQIRGEYFTGTSRLPTIYTRFGTLVVVQSALWCIKLCHLSRLCRAEWFS